MASMNTTMKIEVISKEIVKPSCPTPPHRRTFKLSLIDQVITPAYVPAVLFYPPTKDDKIELAAVSSRCDIIKKSLSETLTMYYPVAGRIKDGNSIIDCNDEGVDFLVTRVHNSDRPLYEFIQHHDYFELSQFTPPLELLLADHGSPNSKVVLAVQVNIFDCGGIVIGLSLSHKIADATSFFGFIKDWAAVARNEIIKVPNFDILSSLFPQRDLTGYIPESMTTVLTGKEKVLAKKFVFEESKIVELRNKSIIHSRSKDDDVKEYYPTRVEALTALMLKCFMDVDRAKRKKDGAAGGVRMYGAAQPVNFRSRMVPPLPTNAVGNMFGISVALISDNTDEDNQEVEKGHQYSELVKKIREAISEIDDKHIRELQKGDEYIKSFRKFQEMVSSNGEIVILGFTSCTRFFWYEADFGWGKPKWVSLCSSGDPVQNLIWFNDTSEGEGIEALAQLSKVDMDKFEHHEELLYYAKKTTNLKQQSSLSSVNYNSKL